MRPMVLPESRIIVPLKTTAAQRYYQGIMGNPRIKPQHPAAGASPPVSRGSVSYEIMIIEKNIAYRRMIIKLSLIHGCFYIFTL